jgi:hypothetical protein
MSQRRLRSAGAALVLVLLAALASIPVPARAETGAGAQFASSRPAPRPVTRPITIGTVPAVAGFPVILDGITSLTDAAGKAHFTSSEEGLSEHITMNEAVLPIDGRQVRVAVSRVFYGADGDAARLALDLSYEVRFRFSSMTGEAVDDSVIDTVTVKSITGAVEELPAHEATWLQGSRVVPLSGGLEVKKLDWTVQRVEYSGSNVVNVSQQKFLPADNQDVVVGLLFYRVSLSVGDAIFGFPQGGAVDVVYPDGQSKRFPLDEQGRLTLPALPRGDYTVTTLGPGPTMTRPLALSRDQDVDLDFYSWLDIGAVGAVVLLLAVGLPLIGWRRRRRHRRAAAVHEDGADDDEDDGQAAEPPAAADAPEEVRT